MITVLQEFLKSYNIEIERHLVTRWHPNFNLDGIQIPPAELPPLTEKLSSAAEVLSQVRELIQGPSSSKASSSPKSSPVKKAPIPPAKVKELKGISSALLQRVSVFFFKYFSLSKVTGWREMHLLENLLHNS